MSSAEQLASVYFLILDRQIRVNLDQERILLLPSSAVENGQEDELLRFPNNRFLLPAY